MTWIKPVERAVAQARLGNQARRSVMTWIKPADRLPELGKIVLVKTRRNNWIYPEDPVKVQVRVARLCEQKPWANNPHPYKWEEFGPDTHFFQDVELWCEVPPLPEGTS